jgi:hypothetical protein
MFRDLLALLDAEINGDRAWEDAAAIHAIDRWFTFSAFHESAHLSADRLREAGAAKVEILEAPADGHTLYGDWMMPLAWDVDQAFFDIIPPKGTSERIADRADTPACLAMWSAPTPPGGVEADLVWVEDPHDPKACTPESVGGKIVFTSAAPASIKAALLEKGALGIVSDFQVSPAQLPGAVTWVNAFGDLPGDWGLTRRHMLGWSFQISPNEGARLRARMNAGEKLRGRAVVRSTIQEGTLPAVTGVIPGSAKEEVLLLGHQFEQGAVDNASGIGVMLEATRALQALISQGKLAPPKRSIRSLFVSECYTTLFWAETSRRPRRTVAGLCLDSPAGSPSLALRPPQISVNPQSQMSYVDALLVEIARQVMRQSPLHAWGEQSFSMTDNIVADKTIDIPCPWIGGHSRTWHTSADVRDVVDATLLRLTAIMSATYAYLIASADAGIVSNLAHLATARGKAALAAAGVAEVADSDQRGLDDAMLQMQYLAERHAEAVATPLKLLPATDRAKLRPDIRALQRVVRRAGKDEAAALARRAGRPGRTPCTGEMKGPLAKIHPRRLVTGPVTFDRIQPEAREGKPSPRWSPELFAVLNWCDGRRSLAEAALLAARELRRQRTLSPDELAKGFDPEGGSMLGYFEFLRRHGYVTW